MRVRHRGPAATAASRDVRSSAGDIKKHTHTEITSVRARVTTVNNTGSKSASSHVPRLTATTHRVKGGGGVSRGVVYVIVIIYRRRLT